MSKISPLSLPFTNNINHRLANFSARLTVGADTPWSAAIEDAVSTNRSK